MTYMHEHLRIDLSGQKGDPDCLLDEYEKTRDELKSLAERGLRRIVDMSCYGLGRDCGFIMRMTAETGINVVISTGFYKDPFMPEIVEKSGERELAGIMIEDIEKKGARIIGEIGTGLNRMTPNEEKVFRAAAIAHEKTNVPVSTHTTLGTMGLHQIGLLKSLGVNPEKIIIGHLDLADDVGLIINALDEGVYVEFDTAGKTRYLSDQRRADLIKECCDRGYEKRLLLSMDITRRSHLKANGGPGYAYLVDSFLPLLRNTGVSQTAVNEMLVSNPDRILGPCDPAQKDFS